MTVTDTIRRIAEVGIVPVVRAGSVDEARRAVEAICTGGIPVVARGSGRGWSLALSDRVGIADRGSVQTREKE